MSRVARLARRALRMEVGVWTSLCRFVLARPRVPVGAVALTYHKQLTLVLGVFVGLSVVEIVVIDLVVQRWPPLRVTLLVLGIWGLTWMLGLLCAYVTRPHAVGPAGVTIRSGAEIDLALPWAVIDSVAVRRVRRDASRTGQVTDDDGLRTLLLPIHDETNVEIVLDVPVTAELPRGRTDLDRVRVFADDPQAFLAAARRFMREHEASRHAP